VAARAFLSIAEAVLDAIDKGADFKPAPRILVLD